MKFTMENETDNTIEFLDITITKEPDKLAFSVYRKPTPTDLISPKDSCHSPEHKHTAIRYLTNRMNTYRLNAANKEKEKSVIQHLFTQ